MFSKGTGCIKRSVVAIRFYILSLNATMRTQLLLLVVLAIIVAQVLVCNAQSCEVVTTTLCEPMVPGTKTPYSLVNSLSILVCFFFYYYYYCLVVFCPNLLTILSCFLVGTVVYVPPTLTFEFIQLAAIRTVQLINLGGHVLEPCRTYGIQMTCATYLRPCFVTPDNGVYPLLFRFSFTG